MANYLLEVGTEELPYKFIPSAVEQLKNLVAEKFTQSRITFDKINLYASPRRLALLIENLSDYQPDLTKKVKGPPANVAFDRYGKLTPAGVGFAKKQGVDAKSLYKEKVGEVEYVFAEINEHGKPVSNVLQEEMPELILKLQGSHFMRWGNQEIKFSRPIRWIVSLLGEDEVKLKIGNIQSSRFSKGHRFSNVSDVKISSPETYIDNLYNSQVIVDQDLRRQEIVAKAKRTADLINGQVILDEKLVEEVTYITEWPVPVLGSFDEKYLSVPKEVIITVMASHQRYFPIFSNDNKQILNHFITMSNYNQDNFDNIKAGNERVIKARLDDAIFFFTEDRKKSLANRVDDLKGVTFQKGLGTVYDKVNRVREISYFLSDMVNLDKSTTELVERTAFLCKADLVTSLVREFTELQGVIGAEYARLDNENELVCQGIKEHYYPVYADADLANTITGQIVGIADKIDTICGVFSIGKSPTGSADPLGLRRAALGILLTILNRDINIDISAVVDNAISLIPFKIENPESLKNDIKEFIKQRLRIYLNEKYRYDLVESVLSIGNPLANVKDVINKLDTLTKLVGRENYNSFHESAVRINKIIKSEQVNTNPDSSLFVHDAEIQLWDCVKSIDENKVNYDELVEKLENCIPVIENFFEKVLVMDENLEIRQNRLSLLGNIRNKFQKLADFSKVVTQ